MSGYHGVMVYWLISVLLLSAFPKGEVASPDTNPVADSLSFPVLNYEQLKPMLHYNNDTTYLVNFFASWCSPCVEELPYFLALDSIYADAPFKLVLVSLDFKKDYLRKLEPFVRDRGLESYVVVLDDNRANFWIDDIDTSWSGAIPATLVYHGNRRAFYQKTFHHLDELKDIVKRFLNQ